MNRDGYWLNYRTGRAFLIDEHEKWLRRSNHAKELGLSNHAIRLFSKFKPVEDRYEFLLTVIVNAPIIRVRGHDTYITFEFCSEGIDKVFNAIWRFCLEVGLPGDFSGLKIVNFFDQKAYVLKFMQFNEMMMKKQMKSILKMGVRFKISNEYQGLLKKGKQ